MSISDVNLAKEEMDEYAEIFELFDGETYSRYTNYQNPVYYNALAYKPVFIKRGKISRNITLDAVTTQITAPLSEHLTRYISNYPVVPTQVKIWRGIVSNFDVESALVFTGSIKKVQIESVFAIADCIAMSSLMETVYPKCLHSAFCQHSLYDAGCGVDANSHSKTLQITGISGTGNLVIDGLNGTGPIYTGGYVKWRQDFRWITLGSNNTLSIHVPFPNTVGVGEYVEVYEGCAKSITVCNEKFNNMANFYGMPYIPSDNPVVWGF